MKKKSAEWWSKWTDGVLAAVILFLLWLMVTLSINPIASSFGAPGLLLYVIGLLAVAMFALHHALAGYHAETVRAWYGIAGGFLSWSVAEISTRLSAEVEPNHISVLLLMLAALICFQLWRFLPVGGRFFCLSFFLNWVETVMMRGQEALAPHSPVFTLLYRFTGFAAVLAAVLVLGWILFHTRKRIQRLNGALALWFMISLAMYVFRGPLF